MKIVQKIINKTITSETSAFKKSVPKIKNLANDMAIELQETQDDFVDYITDVFQKEEESFPEQITIQDCFPKKTKTQIIKDFFRNIFKRK